MFCYIFIRLNYNNIFSHIEKCFAEKELAIKYITKKMLNHELEASCYKICEVCRKSLTVDDDFYAHYFYGFSSYYSKLTCSECDDKYVPDGKIEMKKHVSEICYDIPIVKNDEYYGRRIIEIGDDKHILIKKEVESDDLIKACRITS